MCSTKLRLTIGEDFYESFLLLLTKWRNFGAKLHQLNSHTSSRWKKFIGDVGVYTVGNIGAKLITFALVPLYTYFIPDTARFGYFDICLTAAFLLSPLITLNVTNGLVRYLLDGTQALRQSVTTAAVQVLLRSLAVWVILWLCALSTGTGLHGWQAPALVLSVTLNDFYGQLARGLGRNRVFVGMGIATAFLMAALSMVMVAWWHMDIDGVFAANILARLLPIAVVEWRMRLLTHNFYRHIAWKEQAGKLLRYSLPLLPTMIIWWVLSFGDRWFVLWAAGAGANGVYAVAARFTGIVYTFAIILQQAWQETAILQYDSDDRDTFFSQIFNIYVLVLITIIVCYTAALHMAYGWLVGADYAAGEQYIFPMAIAAGIYSVATFFEMGYQCSKQTHRALAPSIVAGIVNVGANLLLAPRWGCYGVIAASLISFTVFAVHRGIDTRRYFVLRPSKRLAPAIVALVIFGAIHCADPAMWVYAITTIITTAVLIATLPLSRIKSVTARGKCDN